MRSETPLARRRWIGFVGWSLLLYGTAMIFLQTEVALKLARGVMGYAGWLWGGMADLPTAWSGPTDIDAPERAGYALLTLHLPLLPWAAWVIGAFTLIWAVRVIPSTDIDMGGAESVAGVPAPTNRRISLLLAVAGLLVALAAGAWLRGSHLLPGAEGQWPGSNFDEMVYYTQTAIFTQGHPAYRDTFMAHPPGVVWAFTPALVLEKAWGGAAAFVAARQWLLLYSILAIPLVWACARKLGGTASAAVSAIVLALDGKAAFAPESDRRLPNVGVLETLVNVTSLAAFAFYLYAPDDPRRRSRWVFGAGLLAGMSAMCKIPGIALLMALLLYTLANRQVRDARWLAAGGVVGAGALAIPFFAAAPGQMIRQVIFFQLLRPQEVRAEIDQAARVAAYPEAQLTFLLAGLGMLAIAYMLWRWWHGEAQGAELWALPAFWAAPVVAVFIVSRSFHSQYYTQWVPPLALLAGAITSRHLWKAVTSGKVAAAATLGVLALPLLVTQWRVASYTTFDTVYQPTGQALRRNLGPGQQAMAFDPGYTFAAGVPPARIPLDGGYIVDTAGFTVYTAEGLDRAPWGDLLRGVFSFKGERNEEDILKEPQAQSALLAGAVGPQAVVLDQKIALPKLTSQSVRLLEGISTSRQDVDYAALLRTNAPPPTPLSGLPLTLAASTLARLSADMKPTVGVGRVDVGASDAIQLGLYWRPTGYPAGDYRIVVRIARSESKETAKQIDTAPAEGTEETSKWRPGFVYPDIRNIPLSAIAAGSYTIFIRAYDPRSSASTQEVQLPQRVQIK